MGVRKSYSLEFKQEAVDLIIKQGLPILQVASDLGIGKSTLDKWVRGFKGKREDPSRLNESEFEELTRLRKENRLLKMERDLLKKTTVYFAKTTEVGTNS